MQPADVGRFVLRVSEDFWAFIDVEDAPFQASLTGSAEGGGLCLLARRLAERWREV